jgi:uncharacterized protein (UPF0264 family)
LARRVSGLVYRYDARPDVVGQDHAMTVKNPAAGGLSDNYFDMIREGFVS